MSSPDAYLETIDEAEDTDGSRSFPSHLSPSPVSVGLARAASRNLQSSRRSSGDSESSESSRRRHSPGLLGEQDTVRRRLSNDDDGLESLPTPSRPTMTGESQERSGYFHKFSLFFGRDASIDDDILNLSTLRRTTAKAGDLPAVPRVASSSMSFAKRSTPAKLAPTGKSAAAAAAVVQEQDKAWATYRRYRVGDSVLVCNTQSRYANLVNRCGYPSGGGVTPEEQRGPYIYVLATVKKVHFEEDAEYYTVTRADTGLDQRADAGKWSLDLISFAED
jgi:hypothetical protein